MGFSFDQSCEPMDIDLSSSSVNAMDISYDGPNDIEHTSHDDIGISSTLSETNNTELLNRKVHDAIKTTNKYKWSNNFSFYTFLVAILFSFMSLIGYQILSTNCKEDLDLTLLQKTFSNKVYGQQVAIKSIIKALEHKENTKILILYGGTGVGKTLLVSLLLNDLLNYTNIYHYTMPTFEQKFSNEVMHGLILCKSSILIIDDMDRYHDHSVKNMIEKLLHKSKHLQKETTLILVYNCKNDFNKLKDCNSNFKLDLEEKLGNIQAYKSFIKFEPLTKEILKKCIEHELKDRVINNQTLMKILKNFNVEQDGCKGVHQKMKYFNIV